MKVLLSKLTLIQIFCFLLGLLWVWLVISPLENHSKNHWEIVIGVPVAIICLLVTEFIIKKSVTSKSLIFFFETLILLFLAGLWKYLIS